MIRDISLRSNQPKVSFKETPTNAFLVKGTSILKITEMGFGIPRILESLAGCRTMLPFAVFCKIGALECNAY